MNDNNVRVSVSKSLTLPRGPFEFVKIMGGIESDLPAGLDTLTALKDLEATLDLFLTNRAGQQPMRPTANLETQRSEATWTQTITTLDGTVLGKVFLCGNALVAEVSAKVQLDPEAPPVQSFLVPRVLDAMWNQKLIETYEIQRSEEGHLTGIRIQLAEGQPDASVKRHAKELTKAITWTLRRLTEKTRSKPALAERGEPHHPLDASDDNRDTDRRA